MRKFYLITVFSSLLFGASVANSGVTDSSKDQSVAIISNMQTAQSSRYYDNYLVRMTMNNVEPMMVSHGIVNGVSTTLMKSLNGLLNGVINVEHKIIYFEGDDHFYSAGDSVFPNVYLRMITSNADFILNRFDVQSLGQGRIADLMVEVVRLIPKDRQGYSIMLAIDQKSGLLVELDLNDINGNLVERFMTVNMRISDSNSAYLDKKIKQIGKSVKNEVKIPKENDQLNWKLASLPKNYRILRTNRRVVFGTDDNSEYMLLTNDFTDISVYLTRHLADINVPVLSLNATTVFRKRVSESYDIAVIGQIPVTMAQEIANNVILDK